MVGQAGRDVLVRIGDGEAPEGFVSVAGIRARAIRLGARLVDGTHADSGDAWRVLMAGAGVKSVEVSGAGAFKDAASDVLMRAAFFGGETPNMELVVPGFGMMRGAFAISELVYGGSQDDEATFSVRLVSAGVVSFEAD